MKLNREQFLAYASDQIAKASKEEKPIQRLLALKSATDKAAEGEEVEIELFKASDDEEVMKFESPSSPESKDEESEDWPEDMSASAAS